VGKIPPTRDRAFRVVRARDGWLYRATRAAVTWPLLGAGRYPPADAAALVLKQAR
jgi:hypothetical protein